MPTGPENSQKKSPRLMFGTLAAIAIAGLILYFFPSRDSGVTQAVFGFVHPTPGSTLQATLSINTIRAQDDTENLTLEASREPDAQIGDMTVCIDAPGFRMDTNHPCQAVDIVNRVASDESRAASVVKLIPVTSDGTYKLLLTVSWTQYEPKKAASAVGQKGKTKTATANCLKDPANCTAEKKNAVLPLGPVRIEIGRSGRFASRLIVFIKDMALPIILLVLGVQLNNLTAERDRRRLAVETAKEQVRKDMEREQDEDRQIVRILLPKVMELASKYYLPLTWNAERFVMASATGMGQTEELVFHLVNFFIVARGLKESAGGIFMKDLEGEKIFVNGNRILRAISVEAAGGEVAFTYVLDRLASRAPKGRWPRLSDVQSPKEEAWMELESWVKKLDEKGNENEASAIRYLFNALRGVLRYESNAPYFNWYHGTGAPITFALVEEIQEPDDNVFGGGLQAATKEFKEALSSYRQRKKEDEQRQATKDRREKDAEKIVAGISGN